MRLHGACRAETDEHGGIVLQDIFVRGPREKTIRRHGNCYNAVAGEDRKYPMWYPRDGPRSEFCSRGVVPESCGQRVTSGRRGLARMNFRKIGTVPIGFFRRRDGLDARPPKAALDWNRSPDGKGRRVNPTRRRSA